VHVKGLEIFHRVVPCHWLDLPTQFTRSCKSRNEVEIAELGVRSAALNRIFAVITTDANELVAEIHDRMPLILASGDYTRWLQRRARPTFQSSRRSLTSSAINPSPKLSCLRRISIMPLSSQPLMRPVPDAADHD
jgi:SOS response associated peptidase (SRAP)